MACLIGLYTFRGYWLGKVRGQSGEGRIGPEFVIDNYADDILDASKKHKIPAEYLAALCMLESGGREVVPSRFEKHVYMQLKMVKLGTRQNYEHVEKSHLKDAGDEALTNLASSWGPFQLMGYKCLLFDINVKDLRGEESIDWGAKWIREAYGKSIDAKDFRSAFHIHNTGQPWPRSGIPRTHDPMYVAHGLKYMEMFKEMFAKR